MKYAALAAASAALISMSLSSCGGGGSGSSAATGSTGTLGIAVTDAPVDGATKVVIKFTAVEIKPQGGNAIVYDIPDRSINLLALAGGGSATLLDGQTVPAGNYEWVRLLVTAQQNVPDSYIEINGAQYPLFIPSGEESGLKLNRGFTVAVGSRTDFTIDFDLRRSVIAPPGQAPNYLLKPVLRIVDNLRVGIIAGSVPAALIPTGCTPFIYVFSGPGVTPDDLDAAPAPDVDPLISVPVKLDNATGAFSFRVPFLEVGSYTVAFTCDGELDTPEGEETLRFSPAINVTVNANQTVTVSL
jgi:hypothetical protein